MASVEKRRSQRVPTALRVKLRYCNVDTFVSKFATNISTTGIFISSRAPKPVGTQLRFEFRLADDSIAIAGSGKVVWIHPVDSSAPKAIHGMGIQFTSLTSGSRELVEQIVLERVEQGLGESDGIPYEKVRTSPRPPLPIPTTQSIESPQKNTKELDLSAVLRRARDLVGNATTDDELAALYRVSATPVAETVDDASHKLALFLSGKSKAPHFPPKQTSPKRTQFAPSAMAMAPEPHHLRQGLSERAQTQDAEALEIIEEKEFFDGNLTTDGTLLSIEHSLQEETELSEYIEELPRADSEEIGAPLQVIEDVPESITDSDGPSSGFQTGELPIHREDSHSEIASENANTSEFGGLLPPSQPTASDLLNAIGNASTTPPPLPQKNKSPDLFDTLESPEDDSPYANVTLDDALADLEEESEHGVPQDLLNCTLDDALADLENDFEQAPQTIAGGASEASIPSGEGPGGSVDIVVEHEDITDFEVLAETDSSEYS